MRFLSPIQIFFLAFIFVFVPSFVFAQPANDACNDAVTLFPSTTCSPVAGDLQGATNTGSPNAICAGATTPTNDVWYRFTATSPNATITLSLLAGNPSGNLTLPTTYIELLDGSCPSSFTSMACQSASTSLTTTSLNPGIVYYVRVYVTGITTGTPSNRRNFNIYVLHENCNK